MNARFEQKRPGRKNLVAKCKVFILCSCIKLYKKGAILQNTPQFHYFTEELNKINQMCAV